MSKQKNIRMDGIHENILEAMAQKFMEDGIYKSKSDIIQKAIYNFAREVVLDPGDVTEIIDDYYQEMNDI